MEKVLIVGSSGYLGKHLIKYLNNNYKALKIFGFDITTNINSEIVFKKINVLNLVEVETQIKKIQPTYVFNFVSKFKGDSLEELIEINSEFSKNLSKICNEVENFKKLILIGSAAEYGLPVELPVSENSLLNPINEYGISKKHQTNFFINHSENCVLARVFNILGPNMNENLSIGSFVKQIKNNKKLIEVGNINSKRDFLVISDVVEALWKICKQGKIGELYNVCSGKSISIKEILENLIMNQNSEMEIVIKKERLKIDEIPDIYGTNYKLKNHTNWKNKPLNKEVYKYILNG